MIACEIGRCYITGPHLSQRRSEDILTILIPIYNYIKKESLDVFEEREFRRLFAVMKEKQILRSRKTNKLY